MWNKYSVEAEWDVTVFKSIYWVGRGGGGGGGG